MRRAFLMGMMAASRTARAEIEAALSVDDASDPAVSELVRVLDGEERHGLRLGPMFGFNSRHTPATEWVGEIRSHAIADIIRDHRVREKQRELFLIRGGMK